MRHVLIAIGGGLTALALVSGSYWIGYHSPQWLMMLLPVAGIFTAGALIALARDEDGAA